MNLQNFGRKILENRPQTNGWAGVLRNMGSVRLDSQNPLSVDKELWQHSKLESFFKDTKNVTCETVKNDEGYFDSNELVLTNKDLVTKIEKLPKFLQKKWMTQANKLNTSPSLLNLATHKMAYFLYVPKNTIIERPIRLKHSFKNSGHKSPLFFIYVDEGSKLKLIEEFLSLRGSVNQNTIVHVAEKSTFESVQIHFFNDGALLDQRHHDLDKDATATSLTIQGSDVRSEVTFELEKKGAHANVYGLQTLKNGQADFYSNIEHHSEETTCDQIHKGILNGSSRAVFRGRIKIHKYAQKVDAGQMVRNIIMNPKAQAFTEPQLEIDADDVKCGHGAAIGQINPEEIFYLSSRGIKPSRALELVTRGHLADLLFKGISDSKERQRIEELVQSYFFDKEEKWTGSN